MSFPAAVPALQAAFSALKGAAPLIQSALAIGTTATSYLSAQGTAQAQAEANQKADERAVKYLTEDYDQVGKMALQERRAADEKNFQNSRDAMKARASAVTAAGEAGVSGLSVDALLGDISGQEARIRDGVNQNLEGTLDQLTVEARGLQRNTVNQMSTRPQPQRPSRLGALLEAGSGVYDAYKPRLRA